MHPQPQADSETCSVCQNLLNDMNRFFDMLERAKKLPASDWLTVEDIAEELKISKSIIYRLIRNGELEAVDVVETNGKLAKKGHYRIKRSSLNQYLEHKKVRPLNNRRQPSSPSPRFPKVKNYLGL